MRKILLLTLIMGIAIMMWVNTEIEAMGEEFEPVAVSIPTMEITAPEPQTDDMDKLEQDMDDTYILARLCMLEAYPEGYGAVAETVVNRLNDERFPDTIEEIAYQKNQFSTASRIYDGEASNEALDIARRAMEGEDFIEGTPLFFCASSISHEGKSWTSRYVGEAAGNKFWE